MRKVAAVFTAWMALGMGSNPAPAASSFPVLTGDEARDAHQKGVLFLDARSRFGYAQGHIPGAVNLPLRAPDREGRLWDFLAGSTSKPAEPAVVSCSGGCGTDSVFLALRLRKLGFKQVRNDKDGFPGWARAERPTTKGSQP